jgi:hypothetical protein
VNLEASKLRGQLEDARNYAVLKLSERCQVNKIVWHC